MKNVSDGSSTKYTAFCLLTKILSPSVFTNSKELEFPIGAVDACISSNEPYS